MDYEMSNSEWRRGALDQYAEAYGEERPDVEYILSPYDTWLRNPYYTGAPGPHPDFDRGRPDEPEEYPNTVFVVMGSGDNAGTLPEFTVRVFTSLDDANTYANKLDNAFFSKITIIQQTVEAAYTSNGPVVIPRQWTRR